MRAARGDSLLYERLGTDDPDAAISIDAVLEEERCSVRFVLRTVDIAAAIIIKGPRGDGYLHASVQ